MPEQDCTFIAENAAIQAGWVRLDDVPIEVRKQAIKLAEELLEARHIQNEGLEQERAGDLETLLEVDTSENGVK